MSSNNNKKRKDYAGKVIRTRSVLLVEHSKAKKLRDTMVRLEVILGSRVRIAEKAGTPLGRMFDLTNLWDGVPCGREECVPCNQVRTLLSKYHVIHHSIMGVWGNRSSISGLSGFIGRP